MNNKKFDEKLLKQCEFLRKLLEQYGIKWKLELEKSFKYCNIYSFFPTFKDAYLNYNNDKILFDVFNNNLHSEEEFDLRFGLSVRTFQRFNTFGGISQARKDFNKVKQVLRNIIVYSEISLGAFAIEQINFKDTIQNMILDGMSFDGFPALEEVL